MMIKITEKCSMGCPHCMNDSKPIDKHMDKETFIKVIDFFNQYGGATVVISGGEPTEHPQFLDFINTFMALTRPYIIVMIATNGIWMQTHKDEIFKLLDEYSHRLMFQVTTVDEYYPVKIDTSLPVFKHENVFVCTKIERMYPQGRALTNHLEYVPPKGPKCANIRLVTHQVGMKSIRNIIAILLVKGGFVCTPHITVNGEIKLGESDLCPVCSNISKTEEEIINDILNFKCNDCKEALNNLPLQAKNILGE